MTVFPKRFALVLGGLLAAVAVWSGFHAFYPVHYHPDTPLSIRLPRLIYAVPGASRVVEWRARVHARRLAGASRWILFGYGEGGTLFGLQSQCRVVEYDRGRAHDAVLPSWASGGLTGTAVLLCDPAQSAAGGEFAVSEMGCIIGEPDYVYSLAHNREIVRLRALASPPHAIQTMH